MAAPHGLSTAQAEHLLGQYGLNAIEAKKPSFLIKLLRWCITPMSLLLLLAAALSFYLHKNFDGWFIMGLYLGNFAVAQWHEAKADQAIATLQKKLTIQVQTMRDGKSKMLPSGQLVPGDVVMLGVGSVIPADLQVSEAKNLSINEAALTGESMPVDKAIGATAYTGSFITTGSLVGTITQTGNRTKFGRTVTLVDTKPKHSVLEHDILMISKFLTAVAVFAIIIISVYFAAHQQPWSELLTLDLSILIAGIPVAMPTVMSLIISLGVVRLTKKHVIVRRLSSLEDLANVNLLLSDKTGTLTKNEIEVERVIAYGKQTQQTVMRWAASVTYDNKVDAINQAVINKANLLGLQAYKQSDFTPADSVRKRSSAVVIADDATYSVAMGSPQIIEGLAKLTAVARQKLEDDVKAAANQGYRSLAVARVKGKDEKHMEVLGLLLLSDVLRADAGNVVKFLRSSGVDVKIMTGDNRSIASRVAQTLGLTGGVMAAAGKTKQLSAAAVNETSVFAEVLPDDKFNIVKAAAHHYVVAATGDGVNDLPALRQASIGIAVKSAVDALKSAADIVLMTNGIGVIKDAVIESRKIFTRTYFYTIYRISESFRLILTIAILSVINGVFPLTPVQIILLALLNDLPIITLAYDRVVTANAPSAIKTSQRFGLASMYGAIGVAQSVSLFYLMRNGLHLSTAVIQTMFFLKLTVSGHLLIYVAHTKRAWWKWLPSKQIIWATSLTQLAATIIAFSGVFFQGISLWQVGLVWAWAIGWMQLCELAKHISQRFFEV